MKIEAVTSNILERAQIDETIGNKQIKNQGKPMNQVVIYTPFLDLGCM